VKRKGISKKMKGKRDNGEGEWQKINTLFTENISERKEEKKYMKQASLQKYEVISVGERP
jgi:hypothetical protein